jgi:hypothetical protein
MIISGNETLDPKSMERSFIDLFKDLIASNPHGILGNTVFSATLQSFQYDTTVATAASYRKKLYDTYTNPVASDIAYGRIGDMSTQLGIPQVGQNFIKFLYDNIATSAIESIIGHHGGQKAQENIITSANAIGATRSGVLGDLTNPRQLNENNQLGLRYAMDAYKSNFNARGEIDIGQTHGLTLDQATMISNAVLQDKSQYDAFVKTAKDKNPQLGDEELRKFKDGIGTSEAVASAFSKQIKEFSGGINQFVASVSKMTGDFEEAINFMQRATGGKLFDAGKDAAKLRKDAVALATNMRIVAADSGMNVQELYLRSGMMSSVFDAAQGRTSAFANMFANKVSSTTLGNIGATAYARWTQANPNATKEQRDAAAAGISANIADYGQGDMSKMNVIMAQLVDTGKVSRKDAEELARRGNAEQMYTFLDSKFGGRLNTFLQDGRYLATLRRKHSRTLTGLDAVALSEGLENERDEKGGRNLLNKEFEAIAAQSGGDIVFGTADASTTLDAYTDTKVLEAAGLTETEAKDFSKKAKENNWNQETIKQELKQQYSKVDTQKLDQAAGRKRTEDVQEEFKRLTLDAYTDTKVLEAAGLTETEAKDFSKKAKENNWNQETIIDEAGKLGIHVNTQELSTAASKKIVSLADTSTVLSTNEKEKVRAAQIEAYGHDVTEEDRRKANRIVATRALSRNLYELKQKWNGAKTDEDRNSILSELGGLFSQAYAGDNGLSLTATPEAGAVSTVDAVIEKNITFSDGLTNKPEEQKKVISAIRAEFSNEYTKTGNVEAAWKAAEKKASEFGPVKADFSREARTRAIRDTIETKAIENVVNEFFASAIGGSKEEINVARRQALIEIKDRYHTLKKENPEATNEDLMRRAIQKQHSPVDAKGFQLRQGGFAKFLETNPDIVQTSSGRAYFDTAQALAYSKDADVTLRNEDEKKSAEREAKRIARGESIEVAAFSSAKWTEDAANAAIGMRQFTSAIADATAVLKNYASAADVLKGDRRDAEAQNMGFLTAQQLSQQQKQSLIDRHGLGTPFVNSIDFAAARRAIHKQELESDAQKNDWIASEANNVLSRVKASGRDLTDNNVVLYEVEKSMGTDFRKYVEGILEKENKDKKKDDPTLKDASQVLAAISAGATATPEEKTTAVLNQTLRNSGYEEVDPEIKAILAPIKELAAATVTEAKTKVQELAQREDIDWNDPEAALTAIAETITPKADTTEPKKDNTQVVEVAETGATTASPSTRAEEAAETGATTASPSTRAEEVAKTAGIATPSTASAPDSPSSATYSPGPWASTAPTTTSSVKVDGIGGDLTDLVNRILITLTLFRGV